MIESDINKRTVESMIKCGAFDSLGITRSSLISCYEGILDSEHDKIRNNISGQMDLFSQSLGGSGTVSYSYPDIPEYPLRELLLIEKEASGLYFSGHLIDGFSKNIAALKPDKISEIIEELSDDSRVGGARYKDRASVKVAGIITEKKTKIIKNGDTMAFLTLEDRTSEIEVIVFAKSYKQYSDILSTETAVSICGTVSGEEGEAPKILLSSANLLKGDSEYTEVSAPSESRVYIKVPSLSDARIATVNRIAALNRGATKVVLFDESRKKYCAMKDVSLDPSEKVIDRLRSIFSPENIVLK
jgi:DNA polymerase-3 subunit alpha